MATIVLAFMMAVELASPILWIKKSRRAAAWILALSALPGLISLAVDLSQPARIGAASVQSDLRILAVQLPVLVLALLSLWHPARFCYWLAWAVNLFLIATYVYIAFFWHVLS